MNTELFIKKIATRHKWTVQSNECFLKAVVMGLEQNYEIYGYYLCPCRDGTGQRHRDSDIICPCVYAEADISEYGQCYCGLFISAERKVSGEEAESIPDRRLRPYPD